MGRYSRSRQQTDKKKAKIASAETGGIEPVEKEEPVSRGGDDEAPSGSLMSLRSGFKSIAGTGEETKKKTLTGYVIYGLVILAVLLFILSFVR